MPEESLWRHIPKKKEDVQKFFSTPAHLWDRALSYFKWCDENPLYKIEQLKKPGPPVILGDKVIPGETLQEIALKRPYSNGGLCLYLGVNQQYFKTFVAKHTNGEILQEANDWLDVIAAIKEAIATQQFDGAAAGQLNPMIIARTLGLADKQEIEQKVEQVREVFKIGDKIFEL